MDDGRGELAQIAAETRVLLERARDMGRQRLVLGTSTPLTVVGIGDQPEGPLGVRAATRATPRVPEVGSPMPSTTEVLVLPGFEAVIPPRAAPIASAPSLTLRAELPQDLGPLATLVSSCRKCGLCETRTQTVFSDGPATARLVLVGEAPGRDEDAQGVPFVGRAGQLLNKMLAAIDLKREEVYICNVLKCRPPRTARRSPRKWSSASPTSSSRSR